MSRPYLRGRIYFVGVRMCDGRWIKRSTGTEDRSLAGAMGRMLDDLGHRGKRAWQFMEAINAHRITVGQLYDAYSAGQLDALRERLQDQDLEPLVSDWIASIGSYVAADTAQHYELHVRSLIPADKRYPRSDLTQARLLQWLASRPVGRSTKRKYHAAMSGFCEYLKALGVLHHNPMREVKAPAAAPPRMRYLDLEDVMRLIEAQPRPYCVLSTLLHGTGMEVSVALSVKKRDIDVSRREIRARGTKTSSRDRIAKIADWAWPAIDNHIRLLTPNAKLFLGITRWTASDKHRQTCTVLEIEDYQLRDSRHTYAVRAIRAGAPFEVVARQLGHADTTMVVRVYGRFKPSQDEMTQWERIAALQDERRAAQ